MGRGGEEREERRKKILWAIDLLKFLPKKLIEF